MGDKTKGLINKFTVIRNDGKSSEGQKHHGCRYFVLDLDHDPHASAAILAYAESCKEEYPLLAMDLLSLDMQISIEEQFPASEREEHKCSQDKCGRPGTHKYFWPGEPNQMYACLHHVVAVQRIAALMGFNIQMDKV